MAIDAAGVLRESIVPCCASLAQLRTSNGHPASVIVKNQLVAVAKKPLLTQRPASKQVVGGSTNPRPAI
jgi:hypothetical protein